MAAGDIEMGRREPRGSRRRPGAEPPAIERIPPRSGLSRAEVVANQRQRIFAGLALALAHHGYEDTKIADVVELSGVSRATFYEHFTGKDACFAAAYEDGVERLAGELEEAIGGERAWANRVSAGLRAGLGFLAAEPCVAHLLLVESLAAARPARIEHERSLERLAEALCPPDVTHDVARLLAGGVVSRLSACVLAGEADTLPELHDTLLQYLLALALASADRPAELRRAGQA